MRLTFALCMPIRPRKMQAWSWHKWRTQGLPSNVLKNKLLKAGYDVEEINEFVKKDSPLFFDMDAIPEAQPVFPAPPKQDRTHPDWNDVRMKCWDDKNFPFEGVPQAQNFTRSIRIKKGLPDSVIEFGRANRVHNQDEQVQSVIKQAYLWDARLEKLPKLRNLEIPQFNFGRQYGIPAEKSHEILLKNFLRLCDSHLPDLAKTRCISTGEEHQVVTQRHGDPVLLKFTPMLTMLSNCSVSPLHEDLEVTKTEEVPSIHPFNSNAGTLECNIYKNEDHFAFEEDTPFPYVHTMFYSHRIPGSFTHEHPRWNHNRFSGATILYNFASALLMARRKFGENARGVLPEPITTQIVHTTGQDFQFCVFQLNNANLDDETESAVKNIVWIAPKMRLFDACEYDLAKEKFEGYNPEVFEMLMGMYGSPVTTSSS